ncbi:hypothetical protein CLI64_08145 [Nostoc sp. CENA543]|uniref:hypothetical protein n=1 Tax=Nostoc sp. CENA543 TaxID=1869241 RepID=UPI000CA12A01|nr:hypothetical protein [Nostoc sp. CENA543]AUT00359.1 hypothetical protein CLI64_08145 [Nostoc sp. CENA543]
MNNPNNTPNTVVYRDDMMIDDQTVTLTDTKTDVSGDTTTIIYQAPTTDYANYLDKQVGKQ